MYERDTQSTTSADTTMQPLASDEREEGILILGGTPIGNLSDASDRLRQALATADVIAVEDTRKLRTLASGLGVHTTGRIIVNHDHNEAERSAQLVQVSATGTQFFCSQTPVCQPSQTPDMLPHPPLPPPTCR